ncbi:uncharacterized protein LOC6531834 [Drosophila yakuba]|uniref:Uncharacterized protein, isoform A n=1 Tax=Drosophila yakuba TaxID=7245 RepID=B4P9M5_DROYA|nr:uncharacterized protein LOC6531834 [Drosophila yakuba]EDW92333.1 uncharacterized protein Dyak_GE11563, isoform A [Drosophila yakuba]
MVSKWLYILALLLLGLATSGATLFRSESPQRQLSWWHKQYYQSLWQQRLRFTTTPRPGATPDSDETRLVYPCYCYKPNPEGLATATPVEQRMVETKDIFFLNK